MHFFYSYSQPDPLHSLSLYSLTPSKYPISQILNPNPNPIFKSICSNYKFKQSYKTYCFLSTLHNSSQATSIFCKYLSLTLLARLRYIDNNDFNNINMNINDDIVYLKISDLLSSDFSNIIVEDAGINDWYEDSQEVYCMILNKCVQSL